MYIILTPKTIFIFVLFLIFASFIAFQYNSFFFGPSLDVTSPKNEQVIHDNIVQISGRSDPYAVVSVNEEEVFVNLDGTFKKSLYVFPGDIKITIIAKNRFGKETKEVRGIKVE